MKLYACLTPALQRLILHRVSTEGVYQLSKDGYVYEVLKQVLKEESK